MASMFESVTRVAIAEIITKHAKESKFGYILTKDCLNLLTNDIFDLLLTSRNLKSAGDRFIQNNAQPTSVRGATKRDPNPKGGF